MSEPTPKSIPWSFPQFPVMRDLLAIGFRQRRLIIGTFVAIFAVAVLVAILLPRQYESEMKILVKHERADAMVSPDINTPVQPRTEVSEEELQSEAELIKSRDLLAEVVVACGLQNSAGSRWWGTTKISEQERIMLAASKLDKDLTVQPIKLTNLISVSYRSRNPELAAKVLNSLANLYIEKHLAINRVPGAFGFFHQQAEEYRKALTNAEEKLTAFRRAEGVVDPTLQKEMMVRKLVELDADAKETRAKIAETRHRIGSLRAELKNLPMRQTTQVRTADNPQLMQRLKSTLLDLEMKRIELLAKYEPTYRPVQEVEAQLESTREALSDAEKAPLRDQTTDVDPTYQSLRTELARSKSDLAATEARAAAIANIEKAYQTQIEELGDKQIVHQNLLRTAKADEENFVLYSRKQEEARISDALDRERISNVVVAVPANVPFKPKTRWPIVLLLGLVVGALVSVLFGFVVDFLDPSFRTPEEVESFLGSPVVAAFPKAGD
jgi:uncharacterized protein involved in exopolysaccharide biosynthesis